MAVKLASEHLEGSVRKSLNDGRLEVRRCHCKAKLGHRRHIIVIIHNVSCQCIRGERVTTYWENKAANNCLKSIQNEHEIEFSPNREKGCSRVSPDQQMA
jgi:hypothetical protein